MEGCAVPAAFSLLSLALFVSFLFFLKGLILFSTSPGEGGGGGGFGGFWAIAIKETNTKPKHTGAAIRYLSNTGLR